MAGWATLQNDWTFGATPACWVAAIAGAVASSCVGNLLIFSAFRWWALSRVTMVTMLQPLAVLPMSWLVLRALPTAQQLAGGLLILAGAAGVVWIHFFRAHAPASPVDAEG